MTENKSKNPLPKMLPGAVCAQMVRCGKPSCKCARGKLHGPYFYRFVWQGGRQRKVYLKQAEVEQVRQACIAHRTAVRKERVQRKGDRQLIRSMMTNLNEIVELITRLR